MALSSHKLNILLGGKPGAGPQEDLSERSEEGGHSVDQADARDDGHDDEPEPQEDVDLLVEDVKGQHAEAVVSLDST